jgi:polyvinyl alcohol dehydrogenase (cytochrome)
VRRRRALFATLLLSLVAVPAFRADAASKCSKPMANRGGDWATYGQDLMGQQRQDAEDDIDVGNVGTLEPVWNIGDIGGAGIGDDTGYQSPPPIVSGGCVFINNRNAGRIVAYDLATGVEQWRSPATIDTSDTFAVTVAETDGVRRVHLGLRNGGRPQAAALAVESGDILWVSEPVSFTPRQGAEPGATQQSSAIVFDGIQALFTTGPDFAPDASEGYALIDATNGQILHEQTTVSDGVGGGVWGTPTIDPETHMLYVGTSNPESKTSETDYDNAIIKIDLRRDSATFGTIVDSYKGTPDSVTGYDNPVCQTAGNDAWVNAGIYGSSPSCGQLDVDFGVGPTLWRDPVPPHHVLGAALQKSGALHVFDTETMDAVDVKQLWVTMSFLGGNFSRIATDGETLYIAANPGVLYAFEATPPFAQKWAQPLTGLPMKGGNVALANGVVYYIDEPGLKAFDAADGTPIPLPGAAHLASSVGSGVAIAGHRVMANHYGVIVTYALPEA